MKTRFLLLLTLALAARAAAAVIDVNLPYKDLRLKDGTVLAEATVKSYNSTANTVVLLANKELASMPASLLPEEVAARLKGLLPAQSSEELTAAKAREAEKQAKAEQKAERRQQAAEDEARAAREATMKLNVKQAETAATKADATLDEVAKFAAAQARIYFNYQDDPLSNVGAVIGSDLSLEYPEPVPGWAGRYRVEGTAYRQYINHQASGYGRAGKEFEILIQTRDRKRPEVVDIRIK